jgi:glycerol-3-phosphate dehydrogenase
MQSKPIPLDCLIFGGGVAGLFTLDACLSSGHSALLLESNALGTGQTIDSQGIIHGGLKYAITGKNAKSALAIREMPLLWRRCLAGERKPDLTNVVVRSEYCHVWRTASLKSKLGWIAANMALRIKPQILDEDELPLFFQGMHGNVARLDEQVIDPRSLLEVLSHSLDKNILQTASGGVEFSRKDGQWLVQLLNPKTGDPVDLLPKRIVLSAGSGNRMLRESLGLPTGKTQERPLHMVMVRGDLPILNGHCIDGAKTRVTITSTQDYAGRTIWQVGGALAEDGVNTTPDALIAHTVKELELVLPHVDFKNAEFATYFTTRAECNSKGARPSDICVLQDEDILTCWPTKLAFAPRLANEIVSLLSPPEYASPIQHECLVNWPRPTVALPPWEIDQQWVTTQHPCKK